MREFKFRAWHRDAKHFLYWISRDHQFFGPSVFFAPSDHLEDFEQYTGVNDDHGINIYEGDILKMIPVKAKGEPVFDQVFFDHGSFRVSWSILGPSLFHVFTIEVIGNIHQSRELLK